MIGPGPLTISTGVSSNLIFNGAGSVVAFSNPFWASNHNWLWSSPTIPTLGSGAIFHTITVSTDSLGATLTGGTFSWNQSGNNVVLNYAAVPEPGTMGLLLVGALGVLGRRRR